MRIPVYFTDPVQGMYELWKAQPNFIEITTPATAGTELEVRHDLGRIPIGCAVVKGDPGASGAVPVGTIIDYGSATPPTGFLECDGTAVSRTTYADLFAVIGTTFGAGDGSTTFDLPDLRGRITIGRGTGTGGGASGTGAPTGGDALTARTIGGWLGAETHTLVTGEIPAHTHTYGYEVKVGEAGNTEDGIVAPGAASDFNTGSAGGGGAHNNVQPVAVTAKMIRYAASLSTNLGDTTTWTDTSAYLKFEATSRALTLAFF